MAPETPGEGEVSALGALTPVLCSGAVLSGLEVHSAISKTYLTSHLLPS